MTGKRTLVERRDPPVFVRTIFFGSFHLRDSWPQALGADTMAGWMPGRKTKLPAAVACRAPALSDRPGPSRRGGHKRLLPQPATAEHHLHTCAEITDMTPA